jgi:hypothetical protein
MDATEKKKIKKHWAIHDKQITMTFDANTAQVKADISVDDKLINITDNTGYYEINSGQIIANPDILLDNTLWKGTASLVPTTLRFKSGLKVEAELGDNIYGSDPYKRSASGGAIKSEVNPGYTLFCIIVSGNEMRGADNLGYQWQLTKQ